MADPDPPDIVGTGEAAELLGVDRRTVIRWAHEGTLPIAAQLRKAFLYWRSDVERLAEQQRPSEAS